MKLPFPAHIQDFTDQVAHFMWLSDFFIGKPGPGSVSEALAMRLTVIVQDSLTTLAQERYNVEWIPRAGCRHSGEADTRICRARWANCSNPGIAAPCCAVSKR